MDLFVLPSLSEGICNTILEAMAAGKAVVATDVGGNSELVVDGETGTLVESDNDAEPLITFKASSALAKLDERILASAYSKTNSSFLIMSIGETLLAYNSVWLVPFKPS